VEREQLTPEPLGLDWLHGVESSMPPGLEPPPEANTIATYFAHKFVRATAPSVATDVVALARRWHPDLIVRESTEYGGSLAAQVLGIPSAALQVASPTLMSDDVLAAVAVTLDDLRPRLDLPPDPEMAALRDELVVCFAPPALHDPGFRLPAGFRSFHPAQNPVDGDVPDAIAGLGAERPLVYATLGTVFNDPAYQLALFPAVLEGLGDAPVDLLLTVGPNVDPSSLGAQRPGARVVGFVPQSAVLGRSAVVVCHGGYGTLLDAVDAAVPLVVVPYGADQYLNAATVERLGIGLVLDEAAVSAGTIRQAVDALLEPGAPQRHRIRELRNEWRALPGPADAVAALMALDRS
jgi:UDP:flavonoid glycosyltransferase YjiC (YdhE family)